jgi:hypothetical protein
MKFFDPETSSSQKFKNFQQFILGYLHLHSISGKLTLIVIPFKRIGQLLVPHPKHAKTLHLFHFLL